MATRYGRYMGGRRVALCVACGGATYRGRCRVCGALQPPRPTKPQPKR